ncbi:MAG TPA: hypothetical protein VFH63_02420 [candidate division Zixibacteria bacterium]|nr:hypothetical protein [candidate division Zixibacteria bacterium]
MLDYRLHYAILAADDRTRSQRLDSATQNRGVRRIFRITDERKAARETGRR